MVTYLYGILEIAQSFHTSEYSVLSINQFITIENSLL